MLVSAINDFSPSFHVSVVLTPKARHLKGRMGKVGFCNLQQVFTVRILSVLSQIEVSPGEVSI